MRYTHLAFPTAYAIGAWAFPRRQSYDTFCLHDEACFPSQSTLAEFNRTVGGRLYSERPINSVCYQDDSKFNEPACNELANQTNSSDWRIDHFPSYQFVNWEWCESTIKCNATAPLSNQKCGQGRVPYYAVHAESVQDVVEYVRFATAHNLRIVIKNTGHDMLGRSSGKGGFAIWTHRLKDMEFHSSFVPKGCSTGIQSGAITLHAGVQWAEAYKFADQHQRHMVGGASTSVGSAGGYLLGGGHSFLSPSLGLSTDNLVEMEIVTPDGELRTISQCSDPDLFWAVRGGGGGTWGVTTKVTYKAHPRVEIHTVNLSTAGFNLSDSIFAETLTRWVKVAPALGDLGVGGAATVTGGSLGVLGLVQSSQANVAQLKAAIAPFVSWLVEQGVVQSDLEHLANGNAIYTSYPSWYSLYTQTLATSPAPAGGEGSIASRLIPGYYHKSDPEGLAKILLQNPKALTILGMAGPWRFAKEHAGAAQNTSVNPVWYDSLWHVMSGDSTVQSLREYAKDGGAYFGESDVSEPDAANAYWGTNYPTLLEIKRKWDPLNAFQVWHGVGSPTLEDTTDEACT